MKNLLLGRPLDIKVKSHKKGHLKLYGALVLVVLLLILLGTSVVKINDFFNKNYLQFNQVINVKLQVPVEIKQRQPKIIEVVVIPPPTPEPTVSEIVSLIAKTFEPEGNRVVKQALLISSCESGWDHEAMNRNSSADGIFQFIDSTWIRMRNKMGRSPDLKLKLDHKENIETAYFLYKLETVKWSDWECNSVL